MNRTTVQRLMHGDEQDGKLAKERVCPSNVAAGRGVQRPMLPMLIMSTASMKVRRHHPRGTIGTLTRAGHRFLAIREQAMPPQIRRCLQDGLQRTDLRPVIIERTRFSRC
jgi:hypothetical protein